MNIVANGKLLYPVSENGLYGFMNGGGEIVVSHQFQWAGAFFEGLATVKVGDVYTIVDSDGCICDRGRAFESLQSFSDGFCIYSTSEIEGKDGYIDRTGAVCIDASFDIAFPFRSGFAVVVQDGKYGVIDGKGGGICQPQYFYITQFCDGVAAAESEDGWGYIFPDGRSHLPFQYEKAWGFSEQHAAVAIGGRYGYIYKDGSWAIKPRFKNAGLFACGLAPCTIDGERYGFINARGEFVIKPQFFHARCFSEGRAAISLDEEGVAWRFIDMDGKPIGSQWFDDVDDFHNGLAMVRNGDVSTEEMSTAYVDRYGEIVWRECSK